MDIMDQNIRDEIMEDRGNIVISASAGSGKTTMMVDKIKQVLEDTTDYKTVAAITFTNKAADEIKDKSNKINIQKSFIATTNDKFVEKHIIEPFITDTYGYEFQNDFTIDYTHEFNTFEEGLDSIKSYEILGVYRDVNRNFKFKLAYEILKNNKAASEYIKYKFSTVFLDEYQDSDSDMHRLFMYLKNKLCLRIFIVGDKKQAIYLWRGARADIFELLDYDDTNHYELTHNFRSHVEIVNYANLFHNKDYFNPLYIEPVNHVIVCTINNKDFVDGFAQMIEDDHIDLKKEITIIINNNRIAFDCKEALNSHGYSFEFIPRTPIDDNTPNSYLLKQLACYIINDNYNIYNLLENINIDSRKQLVRRLEEILKILKDKSYTHIDENLLTAQLNKLEDLLEFNFTNNEIPLLFSAIQDSKYHVAFLPSNNKHKVMTVFASKGLEFEQVISFSSYYDLSSSERSNNHYVCITRAEDKFIMIDNNGQYKNMILKKIEEEEMIKDASYIFKELNY